MALAPTAVYGQGRRLFDLVIGGFAAAGVALPERRVLSPGISAPSDGPQLLLFLEAITAGGPGQPVGTFQRSPAGYRTATWVVAILRAVHVQGGDGGFAPDPVDIEADAEMTWTDAAVVQDLLETARHRNQLVAAGIPVTISPVTPIGPEGGLAGVQVTVSLGLEGEPA